MAFGKGDRVKVHRPMPVRRVGRKKMFPFWLYPDVYEVVGISDDSALVKDEVGEAFFVPLRELLLVEKGPVLLICPECGKEYKTERGLKNHVRMKHDYFG